MKPDEPEIDPALPTTVTASGRVVYDPLRARRVEVEPAASGDVRELLGELRALEEGDVRDAVPAPVALTPSEDGALVTEPAQDAARAHLEAPVPEPAPQGRVESAPVKIVDPRRLPTMRIETRGPPPAPIAAETHVSDPIVPATRPPISRRAGLVIGAVSLAAVVTFAISRGWRDDGSGSTATPTTSATPTASETTSDPIGSSTATRSPTDAMGLGTSSESEQPAPTTQGPPSTTGAATSAHTATPPTATTVTISKTATASTTATEPLVPTTTPSPTQTAAPAVSSAPSTKPGASAPPPSDTTFVIQPKGTIP